MRASQQLKSLFENFHSARRTRETFWLLFSLWRRRLSSKSDAACRECNPALELLEQPSKMYIAFRIYKAIAAEHLCTHQSGGKKQNGRPIMSNQWLRIFFLHCARPRPLFVGEDEKDKFERTLARTAHKHAF
jgi:hypothetical protein